MSIRPFLRATLAAALGCISLSSNAAGLGTNLVVNGDAESALSGWSAFGGVSLFEAAEYGSNWVLPSQPGPANRGTHLFVGGSVAYAAAFQSLDLTGIPAATLGSGTQGYTLSGWLGGWLSQTDNVKVTAQFLDAGSALLGSATLGPTTAADRNGQTGLTLFSASGVLPENTRAISLIMEMTRLEGGDNDGYADNLSFVLSPVPEPAVWALALAGIGVVGVRASRQSASRKEA